jgi:hypothetical protein
MKRAAIVITAAAISGIGIATANAAVGLNSPTTAPSAAVVSSHPNKPAQDANLAADKKIDKLFCGLTNDALTSNDMSKLVSYFDSASQKRISQSSTFSEGYGAKLDAQIQQISRDWKQKYGHDFDVKSHDTFGSSFASIEQGNPKTDARLASSVMKAENETAQSFSGDEAIALADIKGGHSMAALEVPFVCEKSGGWRIAVPNSLTADRLRQNLLDELTAVNQHSAQLPANETDAYRHVGHRVLMAILDNPMAAAQANAFVPQPGVQATPVATSTTHWWQFWRW